MGSTGCAASRSPQCSRSTRGRRGHREASSASTRSSCSAASSSPPYCYANGRARVASACASSGRDGSRGSSPRLVLMIVVVMIIAAVHHQDTVMALRVDAAAAMGYVANWRFLLEQRVTSAKPRRRRCSSTPGRSRSRSSSTWCGRCSSLCWRVLVVPVSPSASSPRLVQPRPRSPPSCSLGPAPAPRGFHFGTDTRVQAILIGAALAALLTRAERTPEDAGEPNGQHTLRDGALHVLAVGGLVGTALLWSSLDGGSPTLFRGGMTVAALATAAIIPSLVLAPDGIVGRVLGFTPLRALGVISYGVYLWHWPIQLLLTGEATGWQGTPLLLFRAVVTVLAATLSYVLVEQPLRGIRAQPTTRLVSFGAMAASAALIVFIVPTLTIPATEPVLAASPVANIQVSTATETSLAAATTTAPPAPPAPAPPPPPARAPVNTTPRPTTTTIPPPTPVYRTEVLGDSVAESIAQGFSASAPAMAYRSSTAPYSAAESHPPAITGSAARRSNSPVSASGGSRSGPNECRRRARTSP